MFDVTPNNGVNPNGESFLYEVDTKIKNKLQSMGLPPYGRNSCNSKWVYTIYGLKRILGEQYVSAIAQL
jgi:hypothetical protein